MVMKEWHRTLFRSKKQLIIGLAFLLVPMIDLNQGLSPSGELCLCPEKPLILTCEVSGQIPSPRIEWMVYFEGSITLSPVHQVYISSDSVGTVTMDHRSPFTFIFNYTSSSVSTLVSTLTVTLDANTSTMIQRVTVNCGQGTSDRAVLHVVNGPPSSPAYFNTEYVENFEADSGAVTLMWSLPNISVFDEFILCIRSTVTVVQQVSFCYTTHNTSFTLTSLLYNQEYNVSLMMSNCVGRSAAISTRIVIVNCFYPPIGTNVIVENYTSGLEGSVFNYSCKSGFMPRERMTSVCNKNGSWTPYPLDLHCKVDSSNRFSLVTETNLLSNYCSTSEDHDIALTAECLNGLINNITIMSEHFDIDDVKIFANCTKKCTFNDNDSVVSQDTTLILSLCVSFVILLVVTFLFGLFLGSVLQKRSLCAVKTAHTANVPVPEYEEVQLKAMLNPCTMEKNEAYGVVQQ